MTRRTKIVLTIVGTLAGSAVASLALRALAARPEALPQVLEVDLAHDLGDGRWLVRPAAPAGARRKLTIAEITRYPLGWAVVRAGGDGRAAQAPARPVAVRTARLEPARVVRRALAFGTVEAEHDARVAAEVPGPVLAVAAPLGAAVARGAALVELDPEPRRLALARADAEVARAQAARVRAAAAADGLEAQLATARDNRDTRAGERERWRTLAEQSIASRDRADQADVAWRAAVADVVRLEAGLAEARAALDEAAAAVALARAARDQAALDLARTSVRAPFDGVVAERLVEVGQWVAAGQPVVRLVARGRVRVRVRIREEEALRLRPGARATIRLPGLPAADGGAPGADAEPGHAARPRDDATVPNGAAGGLAHAREVAAFPGVVEGVAAAADPQTRTFAVDVGAAAGAAAPGLRPGVFARVELDLGAVDDALLVPDGAVVADAAGHFVYVVEEAAGAEAAGAGAAGAEAVGAAPGLRARRRAVALGARQGEARLVVAGLQGPCEVVTDGTALLWDGAPLFRLED